MVTEMRNMTDKNEYLYDAFISYRHSELDKFVAETLHQEMESFKLPRNLIKKMDDNKKTRINRVFRDRDELPIASNLADPITEALEASEFLLVICSPRLPESLWCKKEIETFINMHDRDHVLAVLIEGEPDDSFPDELRFIENKKINSDGTVTIERILVEPLAADVRGKSQREIKKKIKEEVIRLAAPMFDCAYDELKQRHRERRMRKILTGAAIGSAICFIFGAISTTMALKIHGQNIEISEKSIKIEEQSEEIKEQYWIALENNALNEADNALELLARGDRIAAIKTARAVLPDQLTEPAIPYTYKAEYALSKSLGVYADGETDIADFMLKHHTNVSVCKLSPNRKLLLTADEASIFYVWDLTSGELLWENKDYKRSYYITENNISFLNDDSFFYMDHKKGAVFQISTQTVTEHEMETGSRMIVDREGRQVAIVDAKGVRLLDTENFEVTNSYQMEEGWNSGYRFSFNEDGSRIAFDIYKEANQEDVSAEVWEGRLRGSIWQETDVLVMDCRSGEITNRYAMKQQEVEEIVFDRDILYVTNFQNFYSTEDNSYFNEKLDGLIYACDLATVDGIKWVFEDPEKALAHIRPADDKDSNLVLVTSYTGLYMLDKTDGSLIGKVDLSENILSIKCAADSDRFFAYTRAGEIYFIRNNNGILEAINNTYRFQCNSDNVKVLLPGNEGMMISLPYSSASVTVFNYKIGQQFETVMELDSYISSVAASPDGKSIIVKDTSDDVGIYDVATGERTGTINGPSYSGDYVFVGADCARIAKGTVNSYCLYESTTGEMTAEYELESHDAYFLGEYNEQVASVGYAYIVIYDTLSGEEVVRVDTTDELSDGRFKAVNGISERLAVVYPQNGELCLYTLRDIQKVQTIPINAAFVENLFFDRTTNLLYVVYKDNSIEVYECKSENEKEQWILKQVYTGLEEKVVKAENLGDGSRVILAGFSAAYLLKDNEVIAELPHYKALHQGEQPQVYVGGRAVLRTTPLYDYEMLMEAAKGY